MPRPDRPNILLIISDQQRAETLGFAGKTPCRTPNLDALATGGVSFDRAITPCPLCGPARASIFTGLCPHQARGAAGRDLDGGRDRPPSTHHERARDPHGRARARRPGGQHLLSQRRKGCQRTARRESGASESRAWKGGGHPGRSAGNPCSAGAGTTVVIERSKRRADRTCEGIGFEGPSNSGTKECLSIFRPCLAKSLQFVFFRYLDALLSPMLRTRQHPRRFHTGFPRAVQGLLPSQRPVRQ